MKPTPHSATRSKRTEANEFGSTVLPVIDSAYQAVTLDDYRGGCANGCRASFRHISSNYFNAEARNNFLTEAALFAVMMVISSWPIVLSVRAMSGLARAHAGF
jgi:hypothetical protein